MTRLLLVFFGIAVLGRLAQPVDATAQNTKPRTRAVTGQVGVGEGAEAIEKPNAHMTKNLRATRNAQRNLQGTPQARVKAAPAPRKATTRPAARSAGSPRTVEP